MKILIVILLMSVLCWNTQAQDRACTEADAIEAEEMASKLNDWEDIYKSFKKFKQCDDGAIAEGYSDSIVRMFAYRWNKLESLIKFTSLDKEFYTFILHHIDATADKPDIERIILNSSKHCLNSTSVMCSIIEEHARKALQEFEK